MSSLLSWEPRTSKQRAVRSFAALRTKWKWSTCDEKVTAQNLEASGAILFPEAAILLVSDGDRDLSRFFQRMTKRTPGDEVARGATSPATWFYVHLALDGTSGEGDCSRCAYIFKKILCLRSVFVTQQVEIIREI